MASLEEVVAQARSALGRAEEALLVLRTACELAEEAARVMASAISGSLHDDGHDAVDAWAVVAARGRELCTLLVDGVDAANRYLASLDGVADLVEQSKPGWADGQRATLPPLVVHDPLQRWAFVGRSAV